MSSNDQHNAKDESSEPKPQTEPAGPGGRRPIKTALGLGDSGDDGWYKPRDFSSSRGDEPIRHLELKEVAIDALFISKTRDLADVRGSLRNHYALEYDSLSGDLSEVLARLVVSAYLVAQYVPEQYVFDELRRSFGCFSDQQLSRII